MEVASAIVDQHVDLSTNFADSKSEGTIAHNISCDLHMDHLNKIVKVAIEGLVY